MKHTRTVLRSDVIGFCMGVRRAVKMMEDTLQQRKGLPIYSLGPLIHNRMYLENLGQRGVVMEDDPIRIEKGIVVIRAHGIQPQVREALEEKGLVVVDATCPNVLESQRTVRESTGRGYHCIIVGDENHGEIQGLAGFAKTYDVIQTAAQAAYLEVPERSMVICQTTLKRSEYEAICSVLKAKQPSIEIHDSICSETQRRQDALLALTGAVDAFLIVGGKNSANTKRLFLTAQGTGKPAWHIEEPDEIPNEIRAFACIGISSGASTPDWIVDEVERRLKEEHI